LPPPPAPPGTGPYQPPLTSWSHAVQQSLASYGARLGGWLIDWVLLAAIAVPILLVTHSIHRTHSILITNGGVVHQSGFNVSIGGVALQAVIVIAYGAVLCGSTRGQTIGMMVVGTRVIDESGGGPFGVPRALGRAAFEYLMAILLFIPWVIDMLFPIWDPKNQTLHDKVARAVVVKG
jgi:uncharacterized RDD family membrane protein YckC